MAIDLHTHSTCSDGTLTPSELIAHAAELGLKAVALTDHDTLSGIAEARLEGDRLGVKVISGIELSSVYDKIEIHIVGLFTDKVNAELQDVLSELRVKRDKRNEAMLAKLNELKVDISMEDVLRECHGSVISRAHFAGAMYHKGLVSSRNEAFERYIGAGKPAYIERDNLSYAQAIRLIHLSGGLAVLAHPLQYKLSDRVLQSMVSALSAEGLDAIEVYYCTHSPSDTRYIKRLADMNGLLYSGGSDFHGEAKPKLELGIGYGKLEVPDEVLIKLSNRRDLIG
jgi:hypothetical protein